ncbi:MAG: hypothetical protein HUU41_10700 [Bryobacteraceae bacterium]|nr:hypothetical protein [Bryobacteraceae bacterium]
MNPAPEWLRHLRGFGQIAPGIGLLVGRAVALAQAVELGLAVLEKVPTGPVGFWFDTPFNLLLD